jgi:PIN domain nuclease of toxin-antitoxin system
VLVWLYKDPTDFPPAVKALLDRDELYVSPLVALELQYLWETQRILVEPGLILENAYTGLGLSMDAANAGTAILWSRNLTWTRDPFDRIITAQAHIAQAALATKDRTIRQNYDRAVWD